MPNKRGSRGQNKCRTTQRKSANNLQNFHRSESSQNKRSIDHKVIHELSQLDLPYGTVKKLKRDLFIDGPENYRLSAEACSPQQASSHGRTYHGSNAKFSSQRGRQPEHGDPTAEPFRQPPGFLATPVLATANPDMELGNVGRLFARDPSRTTCSSNSSGIATGRIKRPSSTGEFANSKPPGCTAVAKPRNDPKSTWWNP